MKLFENDVYKAKQIYDEDQPQFDCYQIARTFEHPNITIIDCWICDDKGNYHPDVDHCPIPIDINFLGERIQ